IHLRIDGGDLRLAVGVVERAFDLPFGNTQGRRTVMVDVDAQSGTGDLQVAIDVGEARHTVQALFKGRGRGVKRVEIAGLQCELIQRADLVAADAHHGRIRQVDADAGNSGQLGAKLLDD